MPTAHWSATVHDSPESEPFAVLGDLVVAVRTPRSRDFVSVEVASTSQLPMPLRRDGDVLLLPTPSPCIADQWHGEVQRGIPVRFAIDGDLYRLTLASLSVHAAGMPWVTCRFELERE